MKKAAEKPLKPKKQRAPVTHRGEKTRFYILIVLLAMSIALAWIINSGMSQTLSSQFN